MSEESNNLTPWQQKNLEYQEKKAAQAAAENPTKKHFSLKRHKNPSEAEFSADELLENELVPDFIEPTTDAELAEYAEKMGEEALLSDETADFWADEVSDEDSAELADEFEDEERPPFFAGVWPVLRQMWLALLIAFLVFLGALYFVSPLSKIGNFTIVGNANENAQQLAQATDLKKGDSIFTVLHTRSKIEKKLLADFPRVKAVKISLELPNNFQARVTEYKEAAYVQQQKKTYLILENGYILKSQALDAKKLQKFPVLQNFSDSEVQTFIKAYESLKPDLQKLITTVSKTPTTATKDFIALNMSDGNQVRVPLSQMAMKLPYYPSIAKQLQAPEVVDMEAGIYAKSQSAYNQDLSSASSSKNAAKTSASSSSSAASSTTLSSDGSVVDSSTEN